MSWAHLLIYNLLTFRLICTMPISHKAARVGVRLIDMWPCSNQINIAHMNPIVRSTIRVPDRRSPVWESRHRARLQPRLTILKEVNELPRTYGDIVRDILFLFCVTSQTCHRWVTRHLVSYYKAWIYMHRVKRQIAQQQVLLLGTWLLAGFFWHAHIRV